MVIPAHPAPDRRRVTIQQAMALAAVSRRTIYNWLKRGHLEYVRTPGGRVRIYADTLFKAPEPQQAQPAAPLTP